MALIRNVDFYDHNPELFVGIDVDMRAWALSDAEMNASGFVPHRSIHVQREVRCSESLFFHTILRQGHGADS